MTATRWWVRIFARWQARVDSIKGQVQMLSIAVTAFSTFSLLLQNSGHGELVRPLGVALAIVGPLYAYVFFEGGVNNQVARDRADMSSNYANPQQKIGSEMQTRALVAALQAEELTDDQREALEAELDETFTEYRDGVDLADD